MNAALIIALFLPLVGACVWLPFVKKQLDKWIGFSSTLLVFGSFLLFLYLGFFLFHSPSHRVDIHLLDWISLPSLQLHFSLTLDALSLVLSLLVTGVGSLVLCYSIGYLEHDAEIGRYFVLVQLFLFSMLLLLLAGDFFLFLIGWEGVGLTSYLLIGFWYTKHNAPECATKAFIYNRSADLGLFVALFIALTIFRSSQFGEILKEGPASAWLPMFTVCVLIGAIGKSAQFPFHGWLPDAMIGPTPISALIHAATMVTAGVYLVLRLHPLFFDSLFTTYLMAFLGISTAVGAGVAALAQDDLKRVLAYSTVSQMGFLFVACSVGAYFAALFHLLAHGFVKGLLFLAAGQAIHACHGITHMNQMQKQMAHCPKSRILFLIGTLALAGLPPLVTYMSKEMLLEEVYHRGWFLLFAFSCAASILTALYLIRAYRLVFGHHPIHSWVEENLPHTMLWPTFILGLCTLLGGVLAKNLLDAISIQKIETFFSFPFRPLSHSESMLPFLLVPAILVAWLYGQRGFSVHSPPITRSLALREGFYIDRFFSRTVSSWVKGGSQLVAKWNQPILTKLGLRIRQLLFFITSRIRAMEGNTVSSSFAWMAFGAAFLIALMVL